jgi:hypothetical protein
MLETPEEPGNPAIFASESVRQLYQNLLLPNSENKSGVDE